MNIRRAHAGDVDRIMAILERHIAACRNWYPAPDREAVAATVLSAWHPSAPLVVLVAERDGEIAGLACAVASRYLWAEPMQAEIRLVVVEPEHRGGPGFARLLAGVEDWAVGKGAVHLSFTLASGIADEETATCLEKRGWVRSGVDMVKGFSCT